MSREVDIMRATLERIAEAELSQTDEIDMREWASEALLEVDALPENSAGARKCSDPHCPCQDGDPCNHDDAWQAALRLAMRAEAAEAKLAEIRESVERARQHGEICAVSDCDDWGCVEFRRIGRVASGGDA